MAYHFNSLPSKNSEEVLHEYLKEYGLEFYDRCFLRDGITFKKANQAEIDLRVSHMIQKSDESTIVTKEALESILRIGLLTISSFGTRSNAFDFSSEVCTFKCFNNYVNAGEMIKMTVTYVKMERGELRARGTMWAILDNNESITLMPLLEGSAVIQVCRPQIIEKIVQCAVCEPTPATHSDYETLSLLAPPANQKYDITTDEDLFVLCCGRYDGLKPGDQIRKINGVIVQSRDHLARLCRFMEPLHNIQVVRKKQKNTTPTREQLSKRLETFKSQEGFLCKLITISEIPQGLSIIHSDLFPLVSLQCSQNGEETLKNGDVILEVNGEPVSCSVRYEIEKVLENHGEATVTVERATSEESKKMVEEMLIEARAVHDKQLKRRKRMRNSPKPKRGPVPSLGLGDEVRNLEGSGDCILYSSTWKKPDGKNETDNIFHIFDEPSDSDSMPEAVTPQEPIQNNPQEVSMSKKEKKDAKLQEIPKDFPTGSNGGGHLDPVPMEVEECSNSKKVTAKHDRPLPDKSTQAIHKMPSSTKESISHETQSIPEGFFDSLINHPAPTEEVARSAPNEKESVDANIRRDHESGAKDKRRTTDEERDPIPSSLDSLYPGYRTPNEEESCQPLPPSILCHSKTKSAEIGTKSRKRKLAQSTNHSLSETYPDRTTEKEQKVEGIGMKPCNKFAFVNVIQSEKRMEVLSKMLRQIGVKGKIQFSKPIRMPVFGNKCIYNFELDEEDAKVVQEETRCRSSWKEKITVGYLAEGTMFISEEMTVDTFLTILLSTTLDSIDDTFHLPETVNELHVPQAQAKIVRSRLGADVMLALRKILWKQQIESLQGLRSLPSSK